MLLVDVWANIAAYGPVCGRAGKSLALHAVTAEMLLERFGDKRTTLDAPCGAKVRIFSGDVGPFMWPPRLSLLPEGWTRCGECHKATGSKRPAWPIPSPGSGKK